MTQTVKQRAEIDSLAERYTFKNVERVRLFLEHNSSVIPLLLEAPIHVRRIFGSDVPMQLALSVDPEYPQDTLLVARLRTDIATDEKLEEAEERLRQLYSEWLVTLPRPFTRPIHFDLEPC